MRNKDKKIRTRPPSQAQFHSVTPDSPAAHAEHTVLAAGLGHALQWVHWSQLETALSRLSSEPCPAAPHCQDMGTHTQFKRKLPVLLLLLSKQNFVRLMTSRHIIQG